ncbi:hypothetical protein E2C01_078755 [Portunus trituberculatus]|uniref:Uncharacterized protein n=1 Tax=Portunus trituberculatus TaxID=210409 RepID=A0A5B7IF64_PORTR|nr:hypothetical protein [Portunus trituberculatus]
MPVLPPSLPSFRRGVMNEGKTAEGRREERRAACPHGDGDAEGTTRHGAHHTGKARRSAHGTSSVLNTRGRRGVQHTRKARHSTRNRRTTFEKLENSIVDCLKKSREKKMQPGQTTSDNVRPSVCVCVCVCV